MHIVEVTQDKGVLCGEILATLPHWFGIAASNQAYRRDVETLPMYGAQQDGKIIGFLALKQQSPHAMEIHVMGVRPEHHRAGAGAALVAAAVAHARAQAARFLTVKTLSASDPDPGYAGTRAFYAAMGFLAVAELPELGGPENPTVLLLKVLD
jgi:N-acetylglutamate synthase-like GNAT family acetyltransferase